MWGLQEQAETELRNFEIMSGLPREILKWIQSLDLSHPVRNTRRDFSNGYLVAEIFSWYFPQEIEMHSYDNGTSLPSRQGNWSQLQRFFQRHEFDIPKEVIEGTIHCKPNAAALLMERIYSLLTNRKIKNSPRPVEEEFDFTDSSYQEQLPAHARSTASMAIKNNIASTELSTDPDRILCRQKAQNIINVHLEHRRQERMEDPRRFGIRPTLGQLCPRRVPPSNYSEEGSQFQRHYRDVTEQKELDAGPGPYTEIQVNQVTGSSDGFVPTHNAGLYSMVRT
ncbi:spermatogenesis-associated protein 4-like isoform X2 [Montipora foliosa]|uniref:spermatogenesis-associated protein 4-like isoform X2 n=2 Tax=Montipora foliosa TaxID=591990 RepID=UPI0035F20579